MGKYQSYKPSGIEWVGEIPVKWVVTKLHFLKTSKICEYQDGNHGSVHPKVEDFVDEGIPFLRPTDVFQGRIQWSDVRYIPEEFVNKLRIGFSKKGDILFVNRGNIGVTCILDRDFNNHVIINPQLTYIRLNSELFNPSFFFYQTQSSVFKINRDLKLGNGSVLNFLGLGDLGEYNVIFPPIQDQLQIVQYLNKKTELIDKLISTKELKIILLKEQRISLVNQIVTKGLNPNVKMKDSGVEWIGEIPEEWVVNKLGRIVNTKQGIQVDYEEQKFIQEEGYLRFLRISDYTNSEEEPRYVSVLNSQNYQVKVDDIVMFRYGDSGRVVKGIEGLICNNLFTIKTKNNQIENNYLFTVLSSDIVYQLLRNSSDNPTLKQVSHTILNNFIIPIPSIEEQLQIVEYLDSKTKEIDYLLELEEKKIDLLKEYRQSLISEVVTGKIKVTTDE